SSHPPTSSFFFFSDPATTEIYTLSLHDALPISHGRRRRDLARAGEDAHGGHRHLRPARPADAVRHLREEPAGGAGRGSKMPVPSDRKSTRLNSSHVAISYAVFCLKKKT